jgi:hypothetical protein
LELKVDDGFELNRRGMGSGKEKEETVHGGTAFSQKENLLSYKY